MIVFQCHICHTMLSAEAVHAGKLMRCGTCMTTLRVPAEQAATAPVPAPTVVTAAPANHWAAVPRQPGAVLGGRFFGKRYGFNCGYCSSRLEATESMAAQEGQCPTCGNQITIPILDRYGRLIDPKTQQIIKQDPHPVHAYAAAGDRAPKIIRSSDGTKQMIQCPRCAAVSEITANNCKSCGMPFTMEGTTVESSSTANGFAVASLVLGIISIPGFCSVGILAILAIVFGIIGLTQVNQGNGGGRGMAVAGMICGAIGGIISVNYFLVHLF